MSHQVMHFCCSFHSHFLKLFQAIRPFCDFGNCIFSFVNVILLIHDAADTNAMKYQAVSMEGVAFVMIINLYFRCTSEEGCTAYRFNRVEERNCVLISENSMQMTFVPLQEGQLYMKGQSYIRLIHIEIINFE